jgi:hypothetical protein
MNEEFGFSCWLKPSREHTQLIAVQRQSFDGWFVSNVLRKLVTSQCDKQPGHNRDDTRQGFSRD